MNDVAIEEIRERRRKLLKDKYNGSYERLVDEAVAWSKQHRDLVVDLRGRKYPKRAVV